jgi:heptosyltransferase II
MTPVHSKANIRAKPWQAPDPPKKILVMRFQALGDTVITLPYLQSLKAQFPDIKLHFLTRDEVSPIPKSIALFDRVITIGGGRNAKIQFLQTLMKLPWLFLQHYDAVLDLQNHKISRAVRKGLSPVAWAEFDVSSAISAGERTRQTVEALSNWEIGLSTNFDFREKTGIEGLLRDGGWKSDYELVVLNPAGSFPSRNWPLQFYVEFARLWLAKINAHTQFVLLLLPALKKKADHIAEDLGPHCINLTGKANQVEAFRILQKSSFVLSEDSGLMHMAWVQGVPTLALFSSTRKDWSAPQGNWSDCLDSSDLECGPCNLEICKYGDNRCLTRYEPNQVLKRAYELLLRRA